MNPTLWDGDIILCANIPLVCANERKEKNNNTHKQFALSKNDIIIFKSTNHSGQKWIKRITKIVRNDTLLNINTMNANDIKSIIVGDGNEIVKRNNDFYINGIKSTTYAPQQNFYFVKGDNKQMSYDSQYFGYIPQSKILAIAQFGLFSIHNKKVRILFKIH